MGDSISTFDGFNPFLYDVFYTGKKSKQAGLTSAEDTWWMKVIRYFGGELCVNDSYSGSYVAGDTSASADSYERIGNLKCGDVLPDIVLIWMGANDCGDSITLHSDCADNKFAFDTAYAIMLERIKETLPQATVYCATLMLTDTEVAGKCESIIKHIEQYNDVIRRVSQKYGCKLIEAFDRHTGYSTIDGTHPDRAGHQLIADRMIEGIKNIGLLTEADLHG